LWEKPGSEKMRKNIKNPVAVIMLLLALIPGITTTTKMKDRLTNTYQRLKRLEIKSILSVTLTIILSVSLFSSVVPMEAQADEVISSLTQDATGVQADGGYFSITHRAADPLDYPEILPEAVDAPIGRGVTPAILNLTEYGDDPGDTVDSLAPKDIGLGQIVVYEFLIEVGSGLPVDNSGIINFTYFWDTETSNGEDFGYDENYGVIAAFVDTSDVGNSELDGDENVSDFLWTTDSDSIRGTFTVSGLNAGDKVVVEVWVVLDNTIVSGIGGVVQSGMIDAYT
jgi:hypothetical protein